ncbi:MAG: O-antigen ligase family protein [Gemmatimonadales bacterium]
MTSFGDTPIAGRGNSAGQMSATAHVRAVLESAQTKRPRGSSFAFDHVSRREAVLAPILGIYLGFAVARLHELFPVLAVPRLLWTMMAVMLITLTLTTPIDAWRKVWRASPQLRLVALLLALAIITIPLGIWMSGSLTFLTNHYTVALAVFIACLLLMRDRKSMRWVIMLYVVIVTVVTASNVSNYFSHEPGTESATIQPDLSPQPGGDITRQGVGSLDPNDLAAVLATTFPLAFWLAAGKVRRRIIWVPAGLLMIVGVIPTASRGGFLGLIAAAVVLALVGAKGWRRVFLIAALAGGAMVFMALAGGQMSRMDDLGGSDYNYTSSEGRIAIWKRGIVWMIRRPWGYGIDNFPTEFAWLNGPERAAHNSLIQYGVELGVAGLAAYLLICATLIRSLLRMRRNAMFANPPDHQTITLTGHVLAAFTGCWVTGFFLSNAYYPLTYMAIGIASAVVLSNQGKEAPATAASAVPAVRGRRRRHFRAFEPA